ncbi:MAG: hypothetical protein ACR2NO_05640 [Chloroflexota bacterium]
MPNNYVRLPHVKADGGLTGTTFDAALLRLIERVSRAFDSVCQRHFYSFAGTRYYPPSGADQLRLDDLISATSIKVDQSGLGTFATVLAAETDYWLWPYNRQSHEPARRVDLNPYSTVLGAFSSTGRGVQVVGVFGYSQETEDSGLTGTLDSASDTTITANNDAAATIYAGDTLLIESEQVHVASVVTTTVTVVRGLNGTVAVAHTAKPLLIRRYPRDLEEATVLQVMRLWRQQQTGGADAFGADGGMGFSTLYPVIRDLLQPLMLHPVGVG